MVVTEAPSVHRATELVCKLYQRFYTQTIYPKVIRNLYATPPSLFVPSAPPWHYVYLRPSVTPCAYYISLLIYPPYFGRTSYYPVTMSWIPCYRVSYYSVPCLTLLCYHVSHYSVTMSLITLYHVLHYPVTMSYTTLSHQGMQNHKKSWQVNHPKEPYPSKQLTCQLVYLFTRLLKISQPFIISSSWTQQA